LLILTLQSVEIAKYRDVEKTSFVRDLEAIKLRKQMVNRLKKKNSLER